MRFSISAEWARLVIEQSKRIQPGCVKKSNLAAAIVHDPTLLILDEPTSGLDPEERESLLNRVKVLAKKSDKSVIISTHILPDVQAICDDVIIIAGGEVRLADKLENLNRPTSPTTQVTLLGDSETLVRGLEGHGLECESEGVAGTLLVRGERQDLSSLIWKEAARLGSTIQSVTPAKNSLEQIFLTAIQESSDANS